MGNTSSSSKTHETRVDQGYLTPHGIYTGPHDWNQHVVGQLILERRLAPFYRPLEEFDNTWDDERILANRRGPEGEPEPPVQESHKHAKAHPRPIKEVQKPSEAQIYRGAVECPICFMVNFLSSYVSSRPAHSWLTVLPTKHQLFAVLFPSHL